MSSNTNLAVFYSGPESVSIAVLFAGHGASVHLLGHHRDELDAAGQQIITSMDSLVHQGKITAQERFGIYSKLQKRVFSELPENTTIFFDHAQTPEQNSEIAEFLKTQTKGVILVSTNPIEGTNFSGVEGLLRIRLLSPGPFSTSDKVSIHFDGNPASFPQDARDHVAAILGAIHKEAVFA